MEQSEKICKWITDKVNDGSGAVVFSLEENDGLVGVWIEPIAEHEKALGYGSDAFEAILDAMKRDAEHRRASDPAEQSGGEPTNAFEWLMKQGRRSPKRKGRRSERSAGS